MWLQAFCSVVSSAFREIEGKQLLKGHSIEGKLCLFMLTMLCVVINALEKGVFYGKREGSLEKGLDEKTEIRIMGQTQCYLHRKEASEENKQTKRSKIREMQVAQTLCYPIRSHLSTKVRHQI